jgi:magnesium-transporting ATPase (P-type)
VGHARAIVVGVGSKTAMGKIRDAMSESVNVSNSVKSCVGQVNKDSCKGLGFREPWPS